MNYYQPNLYGNYPYGSYGQVQNTMMQQPPQQASYGLQGKVVDSGEIVKVTDVPFGTYGVFPKADMSEIYIKTWNNNGTTNIITYKPIATEDKAKIEEDERQKHTQLILDRMNEIENKLDNLLQQKEKPQALSSVSSTNSQRKELNINAY